MLSPDPVLRWYGIGSETVGSTADNLSLVAVIAGKGGAAVFKSGDGSVEAVRVGEAIRSGVRLVAVAPDAVTLDREGVRRQLAFPQAGARPIAASAVTPRAPGGGVSKSIRITRGQMVAALRDSNVGAWDAGLSAAPGGGIRVERVSFQPFARLLGFADGDVLKHINQRPLLQVADISLISHYFGQHTSVTIDLVRKGAAVTRIYEILP